MAVTDVKQRLADILATLTGVQRSYADASLDNISAADAPAFVVMTDAASYDGSLGIDVLRVTRRYRLLLLAKPMELGAEFEAEQAVTPFFDRVQAALSIRPGLWLSDNTDGIRYVTDTRLLDDSGFIAIALGAGFWAGAEWTYEVVTLENILKGA